MIDRPGARTEPHTGRRILVVDDDPDLRRTVGWALEAAGYEVVARGSVAEAVAWMSRHGLPHLAILDIVMPGRSGLELAAEIGKYSDMPVILLTGVDDAGIVATSIDRLAEDYVRKPFHSEELVARVGRVLRRIADFAYAEAPRARLATELEVDFVHQIAWVRATKVQLTATESKLLFVLAANAPRTVRIEHLLQRLWPRGDALEDSLRVHVRRIRQKLESDPAKPVFVQTVRGAGYRLGPERVGD